MKLLTKRTDYAVRALGYLATHTGQYIASDVIARAENIPSSFLRRVIAILIKEGIVAAKEGKNGGVQLAVQPAAITIVDLMEMFQGKIELSECMVRKDICPNRRSCMLRRKILEAEQRLIKDIEGIRLSDLIDNKEAVWREELS
jgi:Rrf2 family protein